jgi:arginine N-succinyltransferase
VVDPALRGSAEKPGKQLAYVRFLYMAIFRERFREKVLAELMPPIEKDGRSLFWEAFGRRFTDLDYQTADKLSRENKEFIQQLFPPVDVYATLFPERVRRVLGAVAPETEPIRHLLEKIGFAYVHRVDPFDGGPHYEAKLADVTLVRAHRRLALAEAPLARGGEERLVGVLRTGRNRFRAVRCASRISRDGETVALPAEAQELLRARPGERVHLIPFGQLV